MESGQLVKLYMWIFFGTPLYSLSFQYCPQWGGGGRQLQLGLPPGLGPSVPAPRPRVPRDLRPEGRLRARGPGSRAAHHDQPPPETRARAPPESRGRARAGAVTPESRDDGGPVRDVALLLPRPIAPGHEVAQHLPPGGGPGGAQHVTEVRGPGSRHHPPVSLQRLQRPRHQRGRAQDLEIRKCDRSQHNNENQLRIVNLKCWHLQTSEEEFKYLEVNFNLICTINSLMRANFIIVIFTINIFCGVILF